MGKRNFLSVAATCAVVCTALVIASQSTLRGEESPPLTLAQVQDLAGNNEFKPYAGNPLLSPGPEGSWDAGAIGSMTVLNVNGVYHMYYEAWGIRTQKIWDATEYASLQIGHATSKDGIHWLKDPANPVISKGKDESDWDHKGTWDPYVIHQDGVFKMWYGGGQEVCNWGYATSKDGSSFEKKGRISDLGTVEDCHVFHDPKSKQYHMYYWDRKPMALLRASSPNETDFDFKNAKEVVIDGETYPGERRFKGTFKGYKFSHVFEDQGRLCMLYSNFRRPYCSDATVRLATSTDGLNWTKVNGNLLEGHDGEMIKLAEKLYAIYYGPRNHFDAMGCDIRVALYHGDLPIGPSHQAE